MKQRNPELIEQRQSQIQRWDRQYQPQRRAGMTTHLVQSHRALPQLEAFWRFVVFSHWTSQERKKENKLVLDVEKKFNKNKNNWIPLYII